MRLQKHRTMSTAAGCMNVTAVLLTSIWDGNRNRPKLLKELQRWGL